MKKFAIGFLFMAIFQLLVGCEEGTIVYDGRERPVSEVEEIMADKLEVENPDMDLEVDIYEEVED